MKINSIKKNNRRQKMLLAFFVVLSFVVGNIFSTSVAYAALNKQINYQGKLTLSSGVAVTNGTYNMEFKLYTSGGTTLWTETRTSSNRVQVTNGLFSVLLGEVSSLDAVDFNQTLYLGVNIGGTSTTPSWDGEMTPRKKLGVVPAAIEAEHAASATKATSLVGGNSTTLLGAMPYQSNTDTTSLLSPNTTTTKKFLNMTGTGTNGAVPAWEALANADIPTSLTGKTYNGLTFTAQTTGFTIAGGTTSKTLTVGADASVSGTNTGDETTATIKSKLGAASSTLDGYLSSTDWNTFNNKQNALTNPVTGTGTQNYIAKFSSTGSAIGNSQIFDNGTNVGIGTTTPGAKLDVSGNSGIIGRFVQSATWTGTEYALSVSGYSNLNNFRINGNDGIRSLYLTTSGGQLGFASNDGVITFTNGVSGNTERMRITTGGNVGIGTTNPLGKFHIKASSGGQAYSVLERVDASKYASNLYYSEITTPDTAHPTWLAGLAPSDYGYSIQTYNSSVFNTRLYIDPSGSVGIGTTVPSSMFSVGSTSQFQVSSAGAVTAVGVNSGTGLIQGTGGLTITGTVSLPANSITDAMVSDTLTASNLVAGSSVVSNAEVDDNLTISGGTINNSAIGATTASTGAFTTLSASGDLTVGATTRAANTYVRALSADGYNSGFEAYGNDQGTGYLYVGQGPFSSNYGGGMYYNGDGSPAFATGESSDRVSFYRKNAGTNEVVFSYAYGSNDVAFRGGIGVNGTTTLNGAFTLGDGGDTGSINTSDWDISTAGSMTGISGITNDGAYTQTGTSANTFTGTSTFSNATYSALFTGGNVGIKTTTPTALLDIKTSAGFARGLRIGPQTTTINDGAYIEFASSSTDAYGAQIGGIRSGSSGENDLVFRTGANAQTEKMRITNGGRVGLNASTPSYDLSFGGDVARTIGVEKISSAGAGSDLNIKAGGGFTGAYNPNGGHLNLYSGVSVGSGYSNINFYTYRGTADGYSDNAPLKVASFETANSGAISKFMRIGTGNLFVGEGLGNTEVGLFDGDFGSILTRNISSGLINIGNGSGSISINSSDWDISTTGAMTGISGIANNGSYTQTGTSANTFTGTSTFSNATYSALFTGGNVGIGTPTPGAKLEVSGTTRFTDNTGSFDFRPVSSDGFIIAPSTDRVHSFSLLSTWSSTRTNDSALNIYGKGTANWNKYLTLTHDGTNGIIKTAASGGDITFLPQGSEKMRIMASGNVGIGIDIALNKLHVDAGSAMSSARFNANHTSTYSTTSYNAIADLIITNSTTGALNNSAGISFLPNGTGGAAVAAIGAVATGANQSSLVFMTRSAAPADGERMRLNDTGLGIGTTNPSYALSFGGNVDRRIGMERATTADGSPLTLSAGGAKAGGADYYGGDLILSSGVSTGSGGSGMRFYVYPSDSGTASTTDVSPMTALSFNTTTSGSGWYTASFFDSRVILGVIGTNVGLYDGDAGTLMALDYSDYSYSIAGANIKVLSGGNTGIGTTTPTNFKLQVNGSVGPNATNSYNLGNSSYRWGCLYYNNSTLGTCASDARLKENVSDMDLGTTSALAQLSGLKLRQFSFINDESHSMYNGLIAQEAETVAPNLVTTTDDGYKAVKYGDIQWLSVKAIQELNSKLTLTSDLALGLVKEIDTEKEERLALARSMDLKLGILTGDIIPEEGTPEKEFETKFFTNMFAKISDWLGSTENGIKKIFAKKISTRLLCVADEAGVETCIEKNDLDTILASANVATADDLNDQDGGTVTTGEGTTVVNPEAPVITIIGEGTINLNIGDTYTELGANVVDNKDDFVAVVINGVPDTSKDGIYAIHYNATDSEGNKAIEVIRKVIVGTGEYTVTEVPANEWTSGATSAGDSSNTTTTETTTTTDNTSTTTTADTWGDAGVSTTTDTTTTTAGTSTPTASEATTTTSDSSTTSATQSAEATISSTPTTTAQ